MKTIEVEFWTKVKIRRKVQVTQEGLTELNRLCDDTIIHGRKYIDCVRSKKAAHGVGEKPVSEVAFDTTKGYEILSSGKIVDNFLLENDGMFSEVFFREVEP